MKLTDTEAAKLLSMATDLKTAINERPTPEALKSVHAVNAAMQLHLKTFPVHLSGIGKVYGIATENTKIRIGLTGQTEEFIKEPLKMYADYLTEIINQIQITEP